MSSSLESEVMALPDHEVLRSSIVEYLGRASSRQELRDVYAALKIRVSRVGWDVGVNVMSTYLDGAYEMAIHLCPVN